MDEPLVKISRTRLSLYISLPKTWTG